MDRSLRKDDYEKIGLIFKNDFSFPTDHGVVAWSSGFPSKVKAQLIIFTWLFYNLQLNLFKSKFVIFV